MIADSATPIWFPCGTAALIAALLALGARQRWVAVPPNVCPNVLAAILGAEARPWFVDIEAERQGLDPQPLESVIDQIAVVLAVHAYGTPCRIDELVRIAHQHGVPVIEDCAVADGATYAGRPVGSFGDIAVFSFGTGKIVDAGGGGALLVNTPARLSVAVDAICADWPLAEDCEPVATELGLAYKSLYNHFYPCCPQVVREDFYLTLLRLAPDFRRKYAVSDSPPARIAHKRASRDAWAAARRQKHARYVRQLAAVPGVSVAALPQGSVPWRCNVHVDATLRDALFRHLLALKLPASTWYPRLNTFMPVASCAADELRQAAQAERTLLNLWLDESTDDVAISRTCDALKHFVAAQQPCQSTSLP